MPDTIRTDHSQRSDAGSKDPSWYTAFFNLAECFRKATDGILNHKMLYSLLSLEGRYINHTNPAIRKRTAGTLSRTIHSKSYMLGMREAFAEDAATFERSARKMCAALRDARGFSDRETTAWLVGTCWPDVRTGLLNEAGEWRRDLDTARLDYEMAMLFESYHDFSFDPKRQAFTTASPDAVSLLSSMLYAMAFGHLSIEQSHRLVEMNEGRVFVHFESQPQNGQKPVPCSSACLIRFSNTSQTVVSGFWILEGDSAFTIGRYTDCSAIECLPEVSRLHCRIYREDGRWTLEDLGSRNGCEVRRNGTCAFSAKAAQGPDGNATFPLEFGDVIALPGDSTYLFASLDQRGC